MAVVEVVDVIVYERTSAQLHGHYLDKPVLGSHSEVYALSIEGWVLGRSRRDVAAVEVVHEGNVIQHARLNVHRPDVAAAYPGVPEADYCGFHAMVGVLPMKPDVQLFVRAVLQDESRITVGVIQVRRHSIRTGFQPRLQPLMLTTYGRTGGTWVTRLLGEHPRIITYRPFEYEPRVGSYWMHILKALSEPASYFQPLTAIDTSDKFWWLGQQPPFFNLETLDPQIERWLGRDSIEALAAFCQNSVEAFYERVAALQSRTDGLYFLEKYPPDSFDRLIVQELYPQAREIILVRDFRDMVCSILAYNSRRGYAAFGRELVDSDEEFVRRIRPYALSLLRDYKSRAAQTYLLRYEDLILRPVETLSALVEYLDLDPTPSTVEGMIQRASGETSEQFEHRTSSDSLASIGRWRRDLDASLQTVCQEALGDVLEEFGYAE